MTRAALACLIALCWTAGASAACRDDLIKADKAGPSAADLRLLASEVLMTAWRRGDHSTSVPAIELIEPVLRSDPTNTAAIHYYIHATEASPHPEWAQASARRLASVAPNSGHLVHMPSHTFMRAGDYRAAGDSKMNFAIQLEAARRVFEVRRRHRALTPQDRAAAR